MHAAIVLNSLLMNWETNNRIRWVSSSRSPENLSHLSPLGPPSWNDIMIFQNNLESAWKRERERAVLASGLWRSPVLIRSSRASSALTKANPWFRQYKSRIRFNGCWQITSMIFSKIRVLVNPARHADTISNEITVQPLLLWSDGWPFIPRFPWVVFKLASWTTPASKILVQRST